MSEPIMYHDGTPASSHPSNPADLPEPQHPQFQYQVPDLSDRQLPSHQYDSVALEGPVSPPGLNPTFFGGESSPPVGVMSRSLDEDYGPSPPGTGSSTSFNAPASHQHFNRAADGLSSPSNAKQYSFVSLPGNAVKKRPRHRNDEIERLYQCSWPNCTQAYGTLNHLNAHIKMQKHGQQRSPSEFKELRKQCLKAKKEAAGAGAPDATLFESSQRQHPSQDQLSRHPMSDAENQAHNIHHPFDYPRLPERSIQLIAPLDNHHLQHDVYPRGSQRYTHGAGTSAIPINHLPANNTLLTPLPSIGAKNTPMDDDVQYQRIRSIE